MDKKELAQKIKTLEGLSNEEKSALLELLHERKKYGLVWEDKPENVSIQMAKELPVLTEVKDCAIISNDENAPNHILIEGDNLHALTALSYTHSGRIDVIYIDPPYNTGKKNDFKYNDHWVDKDDAYRHSKWLSFMSKRLEIAKQLLSDKGVIFISIDDNEQAQLKLLCDEVFGSENCLGPIIQDKLNSKNDTINIQKNHEFIICYRNKTILENGKIKPNIVLKETKEIEVFKYSDDEYYYLNDAITTRGEGGILNARANLGYTFYYNPITKHCIPKSDYDIELAKTSNSIKEIYTNDTKLIKQGYVTIRPPKVRGKLGAWTWELSKAISDLKYLYFKKTKNRYSVIKRTFVQASKVKKIDENNYIYIEEKKHNSKSILPFSTNDGTDNFREIMGFDYEFNNPKNPEMLKYLLSICIDSNLCLDFFAGSGTFLQAVMQLNAEDGAHRQCILVTNNENNICEEITYERNRRVIQGYTKPNGEEVEGLNSNNLRYYKTTFVPREKTMTNMRALTAAATDILCIKNNVYQEVGVFGGVTLPAKVGRYFDDGKTKMLIIYLEAAVSKFVELLLNMDVEGKIRVYVFSNTNYAYNDDFEEVLDKVELCALPDAIYKAYKKVLPSNKIIEDTESSSENEADNADEEDEK